MAFLNFSKIVLKYRYRNNFKTIFLTVIPYNYDNFLTMTDLKRSVTASGSLALHSLYMTFHSAVTLSAISWSKKIGLVLHVHQREHGREVCIPVSPLIPNLQCSHGSEVGGISHYLNKLKRPVHSEVTSKNKVQMTSVVKCPALLCAWALGFTNKTLLMTVGICRIGIWRFLKKNGDKKHKIAW